MVQKRKFDSNDGDAAIQHWRKENMASSRHVRGDIRPPLRSLDLNVAGGPHGTQERAQPSYIQYPNILEQHTTTVNGGLEGITANQNQEAIEADLEPPGTSSGNAIVLADEPDGPLYSGGVVTPAALFTAPTTLGVTPEVLNHATTVAEPPIDFASSGLLEAGAGTAESLLQTIANTEGANNAAATPGFPAYQPHFRTTQDALNFRKESRRIAPYIDPKNDATIELVVAEMPQWIALLYNSMVNRQGVRDSATSQGYKKLVLNKHYEPEEIEAACIDIMMEVLNLCQNGCELHHDLAILSEDRDDNKHDCFMRMIHICYALKFEKSICDEVLVAIVGDRVIKQFVNAPVAWRGRRIELAIGTKLRSSDKTKKPRRWACPLTR
ncbi:hypothetical protein BU16DRAFT_339688 [Lophium mytilinum]|uniref:Uncharacterized protein n=1 Tax=Lophium mytilinum TaxID=390894 RepID=A0A6A6QWV2_9PEZI|nr:hypothetical protein BU16DRAFT_339688 [Lophium mytilinum]